jgi:hypothetical protein
MSYLNKVVVNNTEKSQRDNLSKVHGGDRLVADIRTPVSSRRPEDVAIELTKKFSGELLITRSVNDP